MAFPGETDSRYLLQRLYGKDLINAGRSLDHDLVMRTIVRNSGDNADGTTTPAAGSNLAAVQVRFAKFPTADGLYDTVWGLIPPFLKDKIAQWAKDNKGGAIAEAIAEFVKTALGMLPIPVPSFFLNGVVNLVVPPLVQLIIDKLLKPKIIIDAKAHGIIYSTTPNTHYVMRKLDRKILLRAGLPVTQLPAHLQTTKHMAASDDGDDDDDPVDKQVLSSSAQPDNDEAALALKQFYNGNATNGCKPLHLAQIMAAQGRTNPACDGDPDTFGADVWKTIKKNDKDLEKKIKDWAAQTPPDRTDISQAIYPTVHDLLKGKPYYVPDPILDSFTAMKVPEATEYMVTTLG